MTTPAFIELGEDDLPAPITPRIDAGPTPTSNTTNARYLRQRGRDRKAVAEGEAIVVPSPADVPDTIPEDVVSETSDLAAVVVRRTLTQMAAGTLKPTLRDGLQAQQLLDRRAEKAADRTFMLNLAMALAGGGVKTPQKYLPETVSEPEDIIEGEFTEQNLAPSHLRAG